MLNVAMGVWGGGLGVDANCDLSGRELSRAFENFVE